MLEVSRADGAVLFPPFPVGGFSFSSGLGAVKLRLTGTEDVDPQACTDARNELYNERGITGEVAASANKERRLSAMIRPLDGPQLGAFRLFFPAFPCGKQPCIHLDTDDRAAIQSAAFAALLKVRLVTVHPAGAAPYTEGVPGDGLVVRMAVLVGDTLQNVHIFFLSAPSQGAFFIQWSCF